MGLISDNFARTLLGMKPRMGRPPKHGDKVMGGRLEIRVIAEERTAYERTAQAAGLVMADWIRDTLNAAAKRALRDPRGDG